MPSKADITSYLQSKVDAAFAATYATDAPITSVWINLSDTDAQTGYLGIYKVVTLYIQSPIKE